MIIILGIRILNTTNYHVITTTLTCIIINISIKNSHKNHHNHHRNATIIILIMRCLLQGDAELQAGGGAVGGRETRQVPSHRGGGREGERLQGQEFVMRREVGAEVLS